MKYQIFEINGRSLEGYGIKEGDLAIVNKEKGVKKNDLVLLKVNKNFLIKRFYGNGKFYPFAISTSNKNPATLDKAKILGKVIAIIKKP